MDTIEQNVFDNKNFQYFYNEAKGRTTSNLESFLTCTTPCIHDKDSLSLSELWDLFEEASSFGIEVPL